MMQDATVRSDWGYWDQLDDRDLRDGEPVRARWPDGTVTGETIRIEKRDQPYQDHGHATTIPDHRAYIETAFRGAVVRVYVRGSGLKLERLEGR
jgi:hypothetical protein